MHVVLGSAQTSPEKTSSRPSRVGTDAARPFADPAAGRETVCARVP
jgi:hypothetical protein